MKIEKCAGILREDAVTIFLFHGVISKHCYNFRNLNRKHVLAEEFSTFLETLTKIGTAVSMEDIIDYSNGALPPKNAFAITFDDGFENNLSVAAPILENFEIPATFYITSDFVENNSMSWIDRIELAIEAISEGEEKTLVVPWKSNSVKLRGHFEKVEFLNELRTIVKNDQSIMPHQLADNIQEQMGFPKTVTSQLEIDLKLNWSGVKELNSNDLFTIGGHTHSHPIMSFLDEEKLNDEVETCLRYLKQMADITTRHFAYPEGLKHCYDERVISCLRRHGIECCPTAEQGYNRMDENIDLFRLKRIFVE